MDKSMTAARSDEEFEDSRSAVSEPSSSSMDQKALLFGGRRGGHAMGANLTPQQQAMAEEVGRKREARLLKNKEAAKECRRKKKEYIECLENRVVVLETHNKALIDELKSLKELHCQSTPQG